MTEEFRTKSGKILTDADIEKLADEAEQGYDISALLKAQRITRIMRKLEILWLHVPEAQLCALINRTLGPGSHGDIHLVTDDLIEQGLDRLLQEYQVTREE